MKKIKLRGKYGNNKFMLIDSNMVEELSKTKIGVNNHGYPFVYRKIKDKLKLIIVSRLIVNAKQKEIVDHINRNPLDNRRKNLRITDKLGNARNAGKRKDGKTSKFKGVHYRYKVLSLNYWHAQICCRGMKIFIGCFQTEKEAANAYNRKAKDLFGEYAVLNKA